MMIENRDYYEVLGVGAEAAPETVRNAFRRLAREHHPDRFQGDARREAELRFQELTEAYNVLSDSSQRAKYDESLASAVSKSTLSSPKEMARAMVAKAIGLLKLGARKQAGELLRQAVAHDPSNSRAHHLWGVFLIETTGQRDLGLRHLDQATKLDPLNVRVLLDASRHFAEARMLARAARLARSAADVAPGDPAVESWLQQLQEMAENGGGEGLAGMSGGQGW